MANTKSAEKRYRQSLKRRARNVNVRSSVKDAVKSAREAIASKDGTKTTDALKAASKTLNKAASKGVLHKRTASRRISRLAKAAAKKSA
ncbi:30S ribosomal protein S20 [Corallococcus sicarius]|uniref:Small ribosomal subunit protein bS20 n=1 Tax=Corallococcus sicarius TaxID=2316726 RepID=A0A3A8M2Y6_9BACT|nr:30S ribosomal protein S20 [Corallococcus sicarius]RKH26557.1 30S ribosomal protein S20 [Corallococcus sicarius]